LVRKKVPKYNRKLMNKCKKIKVIISDVDGVLTDGGMYYSSSGELLKKFNTKDGMAVEILLNNKIKTIIMTREKSKIVKLRSKKMNVAESLIGIKHKEKSLSKICKKFNVKSEEICYVGDDVNDLEIMKLVGLSASPNDAVLSIKQTSDYICNTPGGSGVLREVADLILAANSLARIKTATDL
jgi:YrbI family 3-deoxy-D-manno-octulosonate 8-phosphate phosphatase